MKLAPVTKYALHQSRASQQRLADAARHAAKHPDDPDAIHDLRVSIRRFTQCLRIFDPLFDPATPKKLRKHLRKLMDLCAAARNCDVALSLLDEVGENGEAAESKLKKARADAEEKLHRRLKKDRPRNHPAIRAAHHPPDGDWKLDQSPEDNLHRVLPEMAADFYEAGVAAAAAGASPRTLHQFRLRAKRFRYTLELFEPFYGTEMVRGANALKGLQDRLGGVNDCVTTIDLLGRDRPAVAAIRKLLVQRRAKFQDYWRSEFTKRGQAWWTNWLSRPARPSKAKQVPKQKSARLKSIAP